MVDDNNFSERLKRIEERKSEHKEAAPTPVRKGSTGGGGIGGTFILLVGVIALGGVGAAFIMGAEGVTSLRDSVLEAKSSVTESVEGIQTAAGSMAAMPSVTDLMMGAAVERQDDLLIEKRIEEAAARDANLIAPPRAVPDIPGDPVTTERMGRAYGAGFAVTALGTAVPVDTVVAGFQPTGPNTSHGDINVLEPNEECTLRPIGSDEKLVNLNIQRSYGIGPIQGISSAGIDATISKAADEALGDGISLGMISIGRGQMGLTDVIITDTSAPLYLVLQTLGGNRLWNIHAAPGVEIAHVSMIANGSSALTGNIGNASFEAIRASDFGNQDNFYYVDTAPEDLECMARPFIQPNETWQAWDGAKQGNTMDGNLLFGQDKGFDAYDYWFTQTLGISANENLISAAGAGAVLVGTAPIEPIALPSAPTPVYMPTYDIILTGSETAREEQLVAIYAERVEAAAGGAYQDVLPDTIELSAALEEAPVESEIDGKRRSFGDFVFNANDVEAKVSLTELNRHRQVKFTTSMLLDELLKPGEDVPGEELWDAYVTLRAPREMMSYCTDTLVEVGTKCRLLRLDVRRGRDDIYSVEAEFAYTPNYTIGDVVRVKGSEFISAHYSPENEDQSFQTPEQRRAFLVTLKELCDQIRAEYGNCLIGRAGYTMTTSARNGESAFGTVEVYLPDNPFEQRNFQERVEAIFAEN